MRGSSTQHTVCRLGENDGQGWDWGAGGEGQSVKAVQKKMFLASTINSMKILGLKVRFQMYFKVSHDFTLLEELVTVSSTVEQGFFPPPMSHTKKNQIKKAHQACRNSDIWKLFQSVHF